MRIDYLIEPKLREKDDKIKELQDLINSPAISTVQVALDNADYNKIKTGLRYHGHQSCVTKTKFGTYVVRVSIESLE